MTDSKGNTGHGEIEPSISWYLSGLKILVVNSKGNDTVLICCPAVNTSVLGLTELLRFKQWRI